MDVEGEERPPPWRRRVARVGEAVTRRWRGAAVWDRWTLALFAALVVLVVATFRDYGVSWDEDVHFAYGYQVLHYYESGLHDRSALTWAPLYYYGAGFDFLTAALAGVSPLGPWETRHLLNALTGLAGIAAAWRLARFIAGPAAGFCAAALLAAMPNYYGHMFNNPKDIPLAAAMTWALYFVVRIVRAAPRPALGDAAWLGLALGLGLGVRVGALLPLCYAAAAVPAALALRDGLWRRPGALVGASAASGLRVVPLAVAIAFPVMLFLWPWAQLDPVLNPYRALAEFSHHPFPYPTLYDGADIPAPLLPRSYLPVHVLLKLPELVLVLLAGALVAVARRPHRLSAEHAVVAFAIVFPIGYAMAVHAVLFDGMRHFLFVLPPVAVLAGIALASGLEAVRASRWRRAATGALGTYAAAHLGLLVALHPDQYVYYNMLVGGVPGASGRFLLDYWGDSYREAVLDLRDWVAAHEGGRAAGTVYRVAVCGPQGSAMPYFPRNFVYERELSRADFYVTFRRNHCDTAARGREIVRVERLDTMLSEVLDLRAAHSQATLIPH
jgi:hypothetical protein